MTLQRLEPVAGLPDDLDAAELPEQEAQLVPRQLLVVDDDGAELLGGVHAQAGDPAPARPARE